MQCCYTKLPWPKKFLGYLNIFCVIHLIACVSLSGELEQKQTHNVPREVCVCGGGGTAAALCADLVFRGSFNSKSLEQLLQNLNIEWVR